MKQTDRALLHKATKWAYQKEYRFIMHGDNDITLGDYEMPPGALGCVALGRKLSEPECQQVVDWTKVGRWSPPPIFCRF